MAGTFGVEPLMLKRELLEDGDGAVDESAPLLHAVNSAGERHVST